MQLPKEVKDGNSDEVRKMLLLSRPGIGKTRATMNLPNSLHIDLGQSSKFYRGTSIDVYGESVKTGKNPIKILQDIVSTLKSEMRAKKDYVYDFIILDTLSELEDWCEPYATVLYKQSPMGKKSNITNIITEGEYGIGYHYLREAVMEFVRPLLELSRVATILVGHTKDSQISKEGKLTTVSDLRMTGKLREIIPGDMHACGTMYVDETNPYQRIVSFKPGIGDIITKGRANHISNKEIIISTMNEDGSDYRTYWHKIFPSLPTSV